jgi:hypothetical protein
VPNISRALVARWTTLMITIVETEITQVLLWAAHVIGTVSFLRRLLGRGEHIHHPRVTAGGGGVARRHLGWQHASLRGSWWRACNQMGQKRVRYARQAFSSCPLRTWKAFAF